MWDQEFNPSILDLNSLRVLGNETEEEFESELVHIDFRNNKTNICGKNQMMLVKGLEGSRKSFFVSCICLGAFISDRKKTMGFQYTLGEGESIIHVDSEMDRNELFFRKGMFNKLAGIEPDDPRHLVYSISDFSYFQKIEIIDTILNNEFQKPSVLIIDQLADLMPGYDVNDSKGAGAIIDKLYEWKKKYNCMIICIMHTNRGGEKTNGILGSWLDKKVQSSFLVEYNKDDHISRISQSKGRRRKIDNFKLMQDDLGHPRLIEYNDIF